MRSLLSRGHWGHWVVVSVCALAGCGSAPGSGCKVTGFSLGIGSQTPVIAGSYVADHRAASPGNSVAFTAGEGALSGPGCATPQHLALVPAQWTVADPTNVSISSADDATNGVATCLGATDGPVKVSATASQGGFTETASALLTCN